MAAAPDPMERVDGNSVQHLRVLIANERPRAFEMLRAHAQHNGQKLAGVAAAIVDSHMLLATAEHSA